MRSPAGCDSGCNRYKREVRTSIAISGEHLARSRVHILSKVIGTTFFALLGLWIHKASPRLAVRGAFPMGNHVCGRDSASSMARQCGGTCCRPGEFSATTNRLWYYDLGVFRVCVSCDDGVAIPVARERGFHRQFTAVQMVREGFIGSWILRFCSVCNSYVARFHLQSVPCSPH